MGEGAYLAVMGYDPDKKVYTYNDFSMGQAGHSEGTITGDTWTWTSDENMGGQTVKGRYTMKVLSPTSYTYQVRNVERWRQLDDRHGRQGHEEVTVSTRTARSPHVRGWDSKNVRSRRTNSAGCSIAA